MIKLELLKTSLTKHGAHKISQLIRLFPVSEVLNNLSGSVKGINIEEVQAQKNLSAYRSNEIPALWSDIKNLDERAIDSMVFVAIDTSCT